MLYTATEVVPFATLSESMRHDPSAIWAHVKPIVEDARKTNRESHIDSAFFLSDGPVTQYKSKANFYLVSSLPFQWAMKYVNWSFWKLAMEKEQLMEWVEYLRARPID